MKKIATVLIGLTILVMTALPICIFAEDVSINNEVPVLTDISFKNAVIEKKFDMNNHEYMLILDDPSVSPSLDSYKVQGNADIFVNYQTDEAKHQIGILVTLEHKNGSVYYNFKYKNADNFVKNGNNLLSAVNCDLGEVYPKINDEDTEYKLYIPSDLKTINLSAVTQDVSAYCEIPGSVSLNTDQNLNITATVYASNGASRTYTFEVKRVHKTSNQVKAEMNDPDYKSMIDGELFYQKPIFAIGIFSAVVGMILLFVFVNIAKRLTIKPYDDGETEFFEIME